ncbi:MAG: peptidoglycan DD-metalloendopeptidase family protein [Thiohalocapsa sp.]
MSTEPPFRDPAWLLRRPNKPWALGPLAFASLLCFQVWAMLSAHSAPALDAAATRSGDQQAASTPDTDIETEMEERTQQLGELEGRVRQLQETLSEREQRRATLYQELERNERDIAALALAGRQLTAMVEDQQRAVAELEAGLARTGDDLLRAKKDLAELLRSAYAMGRGDRLRMLLNREDVTRSERVFGYYRCIGRVRAERVERVEQLAAELERLRAEAKDEAERLLRLAERQTETRRRLEAAQVERNVIVADLDAIISQGRGELQALHADAQQLRTLIDRLQRQVQIAAEIGVSQEAIASRKGKLSWPIAQARLTSRFRSGDSDQDLHADGVLIEAEEGSEVHAVHHGRVVYADWLRGFGLLLVIDHGDGYMTLYGHNQTLLTEVGEWIATGEVIALTGASGGSGSRGLYFALRHQGAPLDPEQWCRSRG